MPTQERKVKTDRQKILGSLSFSLAFSLALLAGLWRSDQLSLQEIFASFREASRGSSRDLKSVHPMWSVHHVHCSEFALVALVQVLASQALPLYTAWTSTASQTAWTTYITTVSAHGPPVLLDFIRDAHTVPFTDRVEVFFFDSSPRRLLPGLCSVHALEFVGKLVLVIYSVLLVSGSVVMVTSWARLVKVRAQSSPAVARLVGSCFGTAYEVPSCSTQLLTARTVYKSVGNVLELLPKCWCRTSKDSRTE